MAAPSGDDTGETTPTDAVAVASGEEKGSEEAPARLEEAAAGLAGDDDEDEVVEGEVLLELGEDDAPPEDSDDDSGDADGAEAGEGGEGADAGPADNSTTTFTRHTDAVYSVGLNPAEEHADLAVSGGGDDRGFLWKLSDGSVVAELAGHTDTVISAAFSSDGKLAATAALDACIKIWSVPSGELVQTLEGPSDDLEWIQWHTKGNVLIAGSKDATMWMWLASTGKCMNVFAGHEASVTCGSFTGNGKAILTGSEDGSVRLWSPKDGRCAHVFGGKQGHGAPVVSMDVHPSMPLVLTGALDGEAKIFNFGSKVPVGTLVHDGGEEAGASGGAGGSGDAEEEDGVGIASVECVGFCRSATHKWCATGATDGTLKIWDYNTSRCRFTMKHEAGIVQLKWDARAPTVFTASVDCTVRVWDARTGLCSSVLVGHSDMVLNLDVGYRSHLAPAIKDEAEGSAGGAGAAASADASGGERVVVVSVSDDKSARVFLV